MGIRLAPLGAVLEDDVGFQIRQVDHHSRFVHGADALLPRPVVNVWPRPTEALYSLAVTESGYERNDSSRR